jgi:hypothetical protein
LKLAGFLYGFSKADQSKAAKLNAKKHFTFWVGGGGVNIQGASFKNKCVLKIVFLNSSVFTVYEKNIPGTQNISFHVQPTGWPNLGVSKRPYSQS